MISRPTTPTSKSSRPATPSKSLMLIPCTSPFHLLPHHVIFYLKEFLSTRQSPFSSPSSSLPAIPSRLPYYHHQTRVEIAWRNLMNTSKALFQEIKKETIYLQLNKYYSIQYVCDEQFRQSLLQRIHQSHIQIGIDLSHTSLLFDHYDLECLNYLHFVDLSYTKVTNVQDLHNIYELRLNSTEIQNISSLQDVQILDLTGCLTFQLPTSPMMSTKKLDLSFCSHLVDVSPFRFVHTLNLSRCVNIVDVSMLGNVYDLNLSGCIRVIDVSELGRVHTLDLSRCSGITDISALGKVHTLYLYNCPNIRVGLDQLQQVHELHISRHNSIELSRYDKIAKLSLSYCSRIITPSAQATMGPTAGVLISPTTAYFPAISPFSLIHELTLDHCDTVDDLVAIAAIPVIHLTCCDKIENINSLHSVQRLTLLGCERISQIDFLQLTALKEISISFCHGITEIESIGKRLLKCQVSYCDGLRKVMIFNSLQCLNINDCSNLAQIMVYGKIGMLGVKCVQEPVIHLNGIVYCMNIEEISNDVIQE